MTALALGAGTVFGGTITATKGPIPIEAVQPGGHIRADLVPPFIPALDRKGDTVGYVSRDLALGLVAPDTDALGRPTSAVIPVFADDLQTVVGFMFPDRGFVPIGVSPDSIPAIPAYVAPAP